MDILFEYPEIIIGAIIGLIIGIAILIHKKVEGKKRGREEIRTAKLYYIFGVLLILFAVIMAAIDILILTPAYGPEELWFYIIIFALFLLGAFLCMRYRNMIIIPESSFFVYRNLWGQQTEIAYSEITSCDFNIWKTTVIRTNDNTHKLSAAFIGIKDLHDQIAQYKSSYRI